MLAIIGCGNTNREDDAVGVYVAQQLLEIQSDNSWNGVTIYDAGTIFEVPGSELENAPEPSYNLHDFRWDHALFAGKKIYKDDFPTDVLVYLIEAKNLSMGIGLSTEVQKSGDRVVEKITKRIETFTVKT